MNRTKIEWVKNPDGTQGYTWNPITGCLNGCSYCYARKLANGRLKPLYLANKNYAPDVAGKLCIPDFDPFYPRFWEDRLDELNPVYGQDTRSMFRGIFACDMSDLFGIGVPELWTRRIMERIAEFPYHRFYLLTKQPQNLIKFSPFPDNCWVGVTATDKTMFGRATDALMYVQAKIKCISFEPLLASSSFYPERLSYVGISWVIIGAQTKPYKPPKIEWVEEIVRACDKAGIPVFLKNNLWTLFHFSLSNVGEPHYWAISNTGYLRQELPIGHNREAV